MTRQSLPVSAIYEGEVVHRRLRPVLHELRYAVASLLVDVDDLAAGRLPALMSYNRFNLFAIKDRDHGPVDGDMAIAAFARLKIAEAGLAGEVARIFMLSYPRILGFTFNPLTVFYAYDHGGRLRLMIYEVHNTFGGRHCYVVGPLAPGEAPFSEVEKTFRVSPFNKVEGNYGLRSSLPGEDVAIGVSLHTSEGPLLKAWFAGHRRSLGNAALLRVFFRLPLMTFKVVAGIHWEALKLWLKGLKMQSS